MLDPKLFFGFPVDAAYQDTLQKANPHAVKLFINNNSNYLHEVVHLGIRYLGKFVGSQGNLERLELLQANIYSIAKRIVDQDDSAHHPAVLLVITE